ncbi:MAG TPA: hypothetical protein VMG10_25725, partial [Gemmataceae bacterium]|nr:hypothetical protein [Gemmataceae bacterium]
GYCAAIGGASRRKKAGVSAVETPARVVRELVRWRSDLSWMDSRFQVDSRANRLDSRRFALAL